MVPLNIFLLKLKKFNDNIILGEKIIFRKEYMKLIKFFYILIGFFSMGLGILGIFLPVLPTVPFLLLSSFCFAKGSKRFHNWFTNTNIYKKHLENFDKNRTMTLKSKIGLLLFSSTMMAYPIIKLQNLHIKIFLILLVIFKYYFFIFKIKTTNKTKDN